MSSQEQIPMLQEFPRWLGSVGIGTQESERQMRWAAIGKLAQTGGRETTETLVRLALKTRQVPAATAAQKIRDTFYSTDNTFATQGNDRELQVLASIALAARMSLSNDIAAETALATSTALLARNRAPDLPMDLSVLADASLTRLAEAHRARPDLSKLASIEIPKFDFEKAAAKARESSWESVAVGFTLAAESVKSVLLTVARRQATSITNIDTYLRTQDEELQMLWWLTGQRSFDLDRPFDDIDSSLKPLIFANELANMTEFRPGPRSVKALLSRAGLKDGAKLSLSSAINATSSEWIRNFLTESEPSPVTTPIHFALRRQLETGPGDAWVAGWAATSELPATLELSPLTLSVLFYRERLLFLFV